MPIKTILTYRNGSASSEQQTKAAIAATRRFDAHLSIAAVAYEPEMPGDAYAAVSGVTISADLHAHAEEEAAQIADEAAERLATEALRGDAFPLVTTPAGLAYGFGRKARYADLVVLSRPSEDDYYHGATRAFEGALFHGDAAVMICPEEPNLAPARAMIAWDGGPAALRSVRRAYPVLSGVVELEIVLVDGDAWQMRSAEELATMLSRYDMPASIIRLPSDGQTHAETLRRHQVESGAEMVVSGAYGRSRFRELLLGGVTRDLPGVLTVPLFMAH